MSFQPFKAKALFKYESEYPEDLSFSVGQIIEVTAVEDDEWYTGTYTDEAGNKKSGLFPRNFVGDAIEEPETPTAQEVVEPAPSSPSSVDAHPATTDLKQRASSFETDSSAPAPLKGLSSRISTFDSASPAIQPSHKTFDKSSNTKSYQGTSSYVPPSFGKKDTTQFKRSDLSHSSYVPPLLGVSRSSTKELHQETAPAPTVDDYDHKQEESEEDGPKMSLKERIALLQKQQKEEAERQAAAALKKQQKHQAKHTVAPAIPSETEESHDQAVESKSKVDDVDDAKSFNDPHSIDLESSNDNEIEEGQEIKVPEPEEDPEDVESDKNDIDDDDNDDEDNDDEEDSEEDSEEAKRAALRERMARLAGAGGMGGMGGGFNPFGGIPSAASSKPKKVKKRETNEDIQVPSAPIPILPFAVGSAPQVPAALQPHKVDTDEVIDEDPSYNQDSNKHSDVERRKSTRSIESSESKTKYEETEPPTNHVESSDSSSIEENVTEVLSDKLAKTDLNGQPRNTHSESAVEGDDEEEKTTSEDEFFSDRDTERERREAESHLIPNAMVNHQISQSVQQSHSDYTTGYESDDDTQANPEVINDEPPKSFAKEILKEKMTSKVPPVPPVPQTDQSPQIPSIPPPLPGSLPPSSIPKEPLVTPKKNPPLPPIQTSVEKNQSFASPAFAAPSIPISSPPVTAPSIPISSPPVAAPPIPEDDDHQPALPVRRTSTLSSSHKKSIPPVPPVPTSPIDTFAQTPISSKVAHSVSQDSPVFSAPPPPGAGSSILSRSSFSESITSPIGRRGSSISDSVSDLASGWWLKEKQLPPALQAKVGKDLIFEVDTTKVPRRGGNFLIVKDYYVLHQDNSETILNITYESQDPQGTVSFRQSGKPAPILNTSELDKHAKTFGTEVFRIATSLVNQQLNESLVPYIFSKIPGILPPVGLKSYGAVIYSNTNNVEIEKIDDFRPGDIVAINKAKFSQHKKLRQKVVVDVGFDGVPFAGVLTEFDIEKKKFRVIELENDKVKHNSYKPSDMKSGKIKVFRPVGRSFVGW